MFQEFTNQYQLTKTLRFELKPIGKTLEYIEAKGLLAQDLERAEDYKVIKEVIDKYHKDFIESSLSTLVFDDLARFEELYLESKKDDKEQKEFEKLQESLRKQIVAKFKAHPRWSNLFKKELIKDDLPIFEQITDEQKEVVKKFANFTTYFTGFHENRANMYTDKEQHSSIAFRIIHDNLPTFLDNKKAFCTIKTKYPDIIAETSDALREHLLGAVFEDMFELDFFTHTATQRYIEIYNTMLGGKVLDDGTKIQGFNEKINLYRQANGLTKKELPNLKPLYKQILSDRELLSWLPEAFEDIDALTSTIEMFYQDKIVAFECCDGKVNILEKFREIFAQTEMYDKSKIFIKNDLSLTTISQTLFKNYAQISDALWQKHLSENPKLSKSKKLEEAQEKFFKQKYFTLASIQEAIAFAELNTPIWSYFSDGLNKLIDEIYVSYKIWEANKTDTPKTKTLLDNLINLQRFLKPLNVQTDSEKDIAFYSTFDSYFEALSQIVKLYDKVRNFKTKKPYSLEKFKLNFENSTLLDGWDVNKEPDNTAILLRKDDFYYLAIMDKKHNKLFRDISDSTQNSHYQKIDYKLLPGANKMLPKVFFSNKNIDYYNPDQRLLERYEKGDHKKGDNFDLDFCHELIDFFKASIQKHEDWQRFGFDFSPTKSYEDLSGFYREVEQQGYKIGYKNIDSETIEKWVDKGKLYLFQIYNKDFSPYSKGTPNMHTLYWKALFDEQNLSDVVYKLNGQAEIFYRKKSIEYTEEKLKIGHHPEIETFAYPIIKDRRFAFDKFQFHVPITLNFKAEGIENINTKATKQIKTNDDIKIIGIDRGERHLLYISLIDSKGHIVEQYSLNQIINSYNNKEHIIDYHEKLAQKEADRAKAREQWGVIENIKELKEGYMSHIVHKIATLMVEHNAIVALEDLNFGFKQGRFKVEKQVYQKFEKALIDKLNYLADKKKSPTKLGGILKALQLTNKFISFEKMGKQNGFLFYVPAWNTSKIDPVTGFVNLFDTHYYSIEKAKEFFRKFKSIRFNESKNYFEFEFDYNDFHKKAEGTKSEWTICTYGERIKTFRNKEKNSQWDNKTLHLTTEFKNLFGNYQGDLKEYILSQDKKEFFEQLLYLLKLTLQMRNSITGSDIDYLISPVADKNGNFYDSRKADKSLPKDADANGAYNIARKGLMLVRRIKQSSDIAKVDLKITNKEWLQFTQGV